MPIEYSLTRDSHGAVYRSHGVLTGPDLLKAHKRTVANIRANRDLRYVLVDHSDVPDENVETASLRVLAEQLDEPLDLIGDAVLAVVAPSDVLFGLSRMFETFAERENLSMLVTRERTEALAWLRDELASRGLEFRLE
jgi:hypothetical protein